jgi:hypothetical protein
MKEKLGYELVLLVFLVLQVLEGVYPRIIRDFLSLPFSFLISSIPELNAYGGVSALHHR